MTRTRRTALWGLGVYLSAALVILLSPTSPEALVGAVWRLVHDDLGIGVGQGWIEFAANVALFAPLGALVTLAARRMWVGVVAALVLSGAVEIAQLLIPGRLASPRDVVANVVGAALGAAIVVIVRAMRRPPVRTPIAALEPVSQGRTR